MAALAALGVDTNKDTTFAADVAHFNDELPAFHELEDRPIVTEGSSVKSDKCVRFGCCGNALDSTANEDRRGVRMRRGRLVRAFRAWVVCWAAGGVTAVAVAQDEIGASCPREALREMMASAVTHDAVADVAALELEVLRLCAKRQALIGEIVDGEAKLAGVRAEASGIAPSPVPVVAPLVQAAVAPLPPPEKARGETAVDAAARDRDECVSPESGICADVAGARHGARTGHRARGR